MKILIADDDPTTLRLVSHAVKALGHEPTTASDGAEALQKFLAEWFPVIITDWEMPEMNGIDLCRQVRGADLPIYGNYIRKWRKHLTFTPLCGKM